MQKESNNKPLVLEEAAQGDAGFLSRWSRRKQGLEPLAEEPLVDFDESQPEDAETPAPEKILTDEDMPPIDTLDDGSDYSGFMSPEVSGELKKLALRKLFRSAKFNITDGLDDYDDDFTSFAALGDLITSDMKHRMEVEAEKKRLAEEEAAKQQAQAERVAEDDRAEDDKQPSKEAQNQPHETAQDVAADVEESAEQTDEADAKNLPV
ncbi:MAG: DUF3306 domain-containing protein [Arenicellales bacterium WSBS_2016_MAG_OTU3]